LHKGPFARNPFQQLQGLVLKHDIDNCTSEYTKLCFGVKFPQEKKPKQNEKKPLSFSSKKV
jgi:hypothetical protein